MIGVETSVFIPIDGLRSAVLLETGDNLASDTAGPSVSDENIDSWLERRDLLPVSFKDIGLDGRAVRRGANMLS